VSAAKESRTEPSQRLRIFLAVFPPTAAQDIAAQVVDRLRGSDDGVSWVKRENLHYTLRFLGDLGDDGAGRAAEAAVEGVSGHPAFVARLGGMGAFPGARRARVLWVGLSEGAEALKSLADSVEQSLRKKGFGRADRPFAPHLTIGRVREPKQDWTAALERGSKEFERADEEARFQVDRVLVVHSRLSPKGSVYTVRHEAKLVG
jgi:2'-5' RNA ligase